MCGGVQEIIKDLEEKIREGVVESQRGGVHNKMEPTELVQVEGVGVEHKMAQWLDGGGGVGGVCDHGGHYQATN